MDCRQLWKNSRHYSEIQKKLFASGKNSVVVDISREYERNHIIRLVENEAALFLRFEKPIRCPEDFFVWLLEELKNTPIQIQDFFERQEIVSWNFFVQKCLSAEIAGRVAKLCGGDGMVAIDEVSCIQSVEVFAFFELFWQALRERVKVILFLGRRYDESTLSAGLGSDVIHLRGKDVALGKDEIYDLISKKMPQMEERKKRETAQKLWEYFGGWPQGVCYAVDLLCSREGNLLVDPLCRMQGHPLYRTFAEACFKQRLPKEAAEFFEKLLSLKQITEKNCKEIVQVSWVKEYLLFLEGEAMLLFDEEEACYRIPGILCEYMKNFEILPQIGLFQESKVHNAKAKVTCFGRFTLNYRGKEPEWRTQKTKELFLFLLSKHGEAVTKNTVVAVIWPECDEKKASRLFYTTMFYLKNNLKAIGMENLACSAKKRYYLNMELLETDYDMLKQIHASVAGEQWPQVKELPPIWEVYQGEFLEDCSADWCYEERTYMERIALQSAGLCGAYELRMQRYENAVQYLEFFRKIDPYSEYMIHMLLKCYGMQKDYYNVKKVYQESEQLYRQELGIDLPEEIKKIYRENLLIKG